MTVSVIIPAWNLWDYTFACLQSLSQHDDSRLEVVVVDNGSTDDTFSHLQHVGNELFGKRFVRVRHDENLGFANACNAGATASHGETLFFLNNDTTVTENWLPPLVDAINQPNIVAVGPLLLYPDGTCQHCGISFTPLLKVRHLYANFPGNHSALHSTHPLQAITGAALMVRRQDFWEAGCFYLGYRNGFEDLDLCCHLSTQGAKVTIAPRSVIIHHESKTPGRHKDENNNAKIFATRCAGIIRPDMHKQVAVDGYELKLSPCFTSYVIAPNTKVKKLNVPASPTIEDLEQLLRQEPLWLDGYIKMVEQLERIDQYEKALNVALLAMRFFPLEQIQRLVLRCAKRRNREDIANETIALLKNNKITKENRKAVLYFRAQAYNWQDEALVGIFNNWLADTVNQ